METRVLTTEEDFLLMWEPVREFCVKSGVMTLSAAISEVCRSMKKDTFLTVIEVEDGIVVAYGCGFFNDTTFFLTQTYGKGGFSASQTLVTFLEDLLRKGGMKKIQGMTEHPVRVFTMHGFKNAGTLMEKEL